MNSYTYSVKREGNQVFYTLFRDVEIVEKVKVWVNDLGFFKFLLFSIIGDEKVLGAQLEKAHVLAKKAIQNLIKYETESGKA